MEQPPLMDVSQRTPEPVPQELAPQEPALLHPLPESLGQRFGWAELERSAQEPAESAIRYWYEGRCPQTGRLLRLPRTDLVEAIAQVLLQQLKAESKLNRVQQGVSFRTSFSHPIPQPLLPLWEKGGRIEVPLPLWERD
ncbi:MAG: hypothetical protein HC824_03840 [Synechococcales cyanobacterium RM1_1_8]|nr:hypothetical protein [Synechococcales cyanobacterium RM1_1_8]